MKEQYETPVTEVIRFTTEDVITDSSIDQEGEESIDDVPVLE